MGNIRESACSLNGCFQAQCIEKGRMDGLETIPRLVMGNTKKVIEDNRRSARERFDRGDFRLWQGDKMRSFG